MSGRDYPAGMKAALHLLSGGGCYRPDCGEPLLRFADGVPEINLQIAHIHALEDDGPRANRQWSIEQRNAFSNLIMLCGPCHKRVDADVRAYPAPVLRKWKRDREQHALGSLAGLRDLDTAGMEDLLHRAMDEIRQDMTAIADAFPDLARLLRDTIEGVPSLDPDSVQQLADAAHYLSLPEYAPMMSSAANRLDLPEYAPSMQYSAALLKLPEYAPELSQAARDLDLPTHVPELRRIADDLNRTLRALSDSTARPKSAALDLEPAESYPPTVYVSHAPRWLVKAALIGWAGWLLVALFIYLHVKGHF